MTPQRGAVVLGADPGSKFGLGLAARGADGIGVLRHDGVNYRRVADRENQSTSMARPAVMRTSSEKDVRNTVSGCPAAAHNSECLASALST